MSHLLSRFVETREAAAVVACVPAPPCGGTALVRRASAALHPGPLAPLRELRLDGERVAEALERGEQGVDLEQGVLAKLPRRERELEVDRVHAVGDLQL